MANVQEDDVKKDLDEDENVVESSNELLDSINNVLADVVDGQKFLVVCLAMGAIQPYLNEVEDRVGCLRRTASTSFAKTLRLASQLSVGASKAIESIAEEYRRSEAQPQPVVEDETTLGNLRRTTSTSLARAKTLVSQLSIGASRAVNYITEELRKAEGEQLVAAAA
jgi:predicted transcriptional regulator